MKNLHKKSTLTSQLSRSLIRSNGLCLWRNKVIQVLNYKILLVLQPFDMIQLILCPKSLTNDSYSFDNVLLLLEVHWYASVITGNPHGGFPPLPVTDTNTDLIGRVELGLGISEAHHLFSPCITHKKLNIKNYYRFYVQLNKSLLQ